MYIQCKRLSARSQPAYSFWTCVVMSYSRREGEGEVERVKEKGEM